MEFNGESTHSSDCMSNKGKGGSVGVDRISLAKNDDSLKPPAAKRQCPDSRGHMSVMETDGSAVKGSDASSKSDGSSKPKEAEVLSPSAMKLSVEASASAAIPTRRHGKAPISDEDGADCMLFSEITQGPHQTELRFRLIHFWEARNPHNKTLIGLEMLLIDQKGTAIQGFIPANRVEAHLRDLKAGCLYKLNRFYGSRSKGLFRVADHSFAVSFSWNSVLSGLENNPVPFPEDRFRFHSHEEFQAMCDLRGDLYDFLGHMKLVNGQSIADSPTLDEGDIAEKRHVLIHVQNKDGPVMKMYLWDNSAIDFCKKFASYSSTPAVILVTTVNPKRLGGTLALTSMSSSRVFMHTDVQPTIEYLSWFTSNSDIATKVNADIVTKPETVTIGELLTYMKQKTAKVAWFECTATIDDVHQSSAWYYISCGGCNTKATKVATSLVCTNKKCGKSQVTGVPQYLAKISVYDQSEQGVFVILGDAGRQLTGKYASELVANYFETNENRGGDGLVPVPQALIDTIGQTHKFVVKVSEHNLTGKSQAITVTKILPADPPQNTIEDADDKEIGKASCCVVPEKAKRG